MAANPPRLRLAPPRGTPDSAEKNAGTGYRATARPPSMSVNIRKRASSEAGTHSLFVIPPLNSFHCANVGNGEQKRPAPQRDETSRSRGATLFDPMRRTRSRSHAITGASGRSYPQRGSDRRLRGEFWRLCRRACTGSRLAGTGKTPYYSPSLPFGSGSCTNTSGQRDVTSRYTT